MNIPKYYPRAQVNGVISWSCVFCGHINKNSIKPGSARVTCRDCGRTLFLGVAFHIPMNAATQIPKDYVIPSWADDEYPFDTISEKVQEAMQAAWFIPEKKIRQRGRVHIVLLYDNFYKAE